MLLLYGFFELIMSIFLDHINFRIQDSLHQVLVNGFKLLSTSLNGQMLDCSKLRRKLMVGEIEKFLLK